MSQEFLLILDDDDAITEGLAMALEKEGRTVITCSDREAAEVVLGRLPISLLLSDIRLTGPFAFEGLDLVRDLAGKIHGSRIVLMTGESNDALRAEARRRGAAGLLDKPFDIAELELLIPETLPAASGPSFPAGPGAVIRIPSLTSVLADQALRPAFQPVVRLDGGEPHIFGFESLARYRGTTALFDTAYLFEYAGRKKQAAEVDLACLDRTLQYGAPLAAHGKIFINVHPHLIEDQATLIPRLVAGSQRHRLPLDRIVIELTEQASITRQNEAIDCINQIREMGAQFALDDVGIAYSHLALIDQIKPSFLKISQEFGTRFEQDRTKEKIVRNIASLAADFGCETILEGIEEKETATAAAEIGIKYAQGYYFWRPSDPSIFLDLLNKS